MNQDLSQLISAVEALQVQSEPWKDYIFPIGTVLLSGTLAGGISYYMAYRQEKTKIEIGKVRAFNNMMLKASQMRKSLIAIKQNYHVGLDSHPLRRMLQIPPIISSWEKVSFDLLSLTFIAPNNADDSAKWNNLETVDSIFSNYNYAMELWEKRSKEVLLILERVKHKFRQGMDTEELVAEIGYANVVMLTALTERVVNITDDVLIEISCFLIGFADVVIPKLDKRILKSYGHALRMELPVNDASFDFLSRVQELDYLKMSKLHGVPVATLKEQYRPLYP